MIVGNSLIFIKGVIFMKEFYVDMKNQFGVDELVEYLRQNKIKYKTSALDGGGKHFDIYCDEKMAYVLDIALDRIFDHIADRNENN